MRSLIQQIIFGVLCFSIGWYSREELSKESVTKDVAKFLPKEVGNKNLKSKEKDIAVKKIELNKKYNKSKVVLKSKNLLNEFETKLSQKKIQEAFYIYQDVDDNIQVELDKRSFVILAGLLESNSFNKVIEYCSLITNNYPYKKKYWIILSQAYEKKDQLQEAIATLYSGRRVFFKDTDYNYFSKIIDNKIGEYIAVLFKKNKLVKIKNFYENTISFYDNENPYYKYWYVKSLTKLGLYQEALSVAENIQEPRDLKSELKKLKRYLHFQILQKQAQENNSFIDLEKKGNHFFVKIIIDEQLSLRLLVDTGASNTIVDRGAISALLEQKNISLKDLPAKLFRVADNRTIKGYTYSSRYLQIGELRFEDIPISIIERSAKDSDFQGLLGMDILKFFDIDNGKLFLKQIDIPNLEY
jgi:predicted aspartyl protease